MDGQRVLHCWALRYEAMGFASPIEALNVVDPEELDGLAAAAGYDTSDAEWERQGGGWWRYDTLHDVCMEPAGHAGAHGFRRGAAVLVAFPPTAGEEGEG